MIRRVADALHAADHGATSIQALIRATPVAPQDIADEFGDADGLVVAVVQSIADWMLQPLERDPAGATFRERLVEFGRRATDEYSGLRLKHLYRIAVTDAIRSKGIEEAFYRHGPERVRDGLARFFASAQAAGLPLEGDSRRFAGYFLAMLRTGWDLSDLSGARDRVHDDGDIARLVEVFFDGIQAEAGDAVAAAR